MDKRETGYQDRVDEMEGDNSEESSHIEEYDSSRSGTQEGSDPDKSNESNSLQPDYDLVKAWRKKPVGMGFIPCFCKPRTGLTRQPNQELTSLDYFLNFFTDSIWDLMVTKTNRYAAQILRSHAHPHLNDHGSMSIVLKCKHSLG